MRAPGARQPLTGRVVLVVGAGSALGQEIARHAAALGAAVVVADPNVAAAARTAGLLASSAGVVRVIETPVPPLLGAGLVRAAREALAAPTDVVLVTGRAGAFFDDANARAAGATLGGTVVLAGPAEESDRPAGVRDRAGEIVRGLLVPPPPSPPVPPASPVAGRE